MDARMWLLLIAAVFITLASLDCSGLYLIGCLTALPREGKTMRFPTWGHTHPSYFRNGDAAVRLDVRPWPCASYWRYHGTSRGTWNGGPASLQNLPRSIVNVDFSTIEARVAQYLQDGHPRAPLWLHGQHD